MEAGDDTPDVLDRDTLRARREAARARRRRARRRGLALLAAALAVLAAAVVALAGAGGGGTRHGTAGSAALSGGTATSAPASKKANQGSAANLDALVAAGKPVYCGGGHERLVALTFDDGPGPYTKFALDQLGRAGARVTWFLVGRNLQTQAAEGLRVRLALAELRREDRSRAEDAGDCGKHLCDVSLQEPRVVGEGPDRTIHADLSRHREHGQVGLDRHPSGLHPLSGAQGIPYTLAESFQVVVR